MMCHFGKCTRACAKQGDCPIGFDCGLQKPEDAQSTGVGATCYKATYDMPPIMGGYGVDCSLVAADPKTGGVCDPKATSPCAAGFTCRATQHCDPAAYCTRPCAADSDCPPTMFCGIEITKSTCKTAADCAMGSKCVAPPGTSGKVTSCVGAQLCRKRTQCSPCGNDDQCPTGFACGADVNGERFCGKLCTMDEHCPQPENSAPQAPVSNPFLKCVASGNAKGSMVCRPTAGTCHGPSAIPALASTMNTLCSYCRPGTPSDCPDGFCLEQSFSEERFCTQACTVHSKVNGMGGFDLTHDTCPMGTNCFAGVGCANCDVSGICVGETNPGDQSRGTTWYAPTCYPM